MIRYNQTSTKWEVWTADGKEKVGEFGTESEAKAKDMQPLSQLVLYRGDAATSDGTLFKKDVLRVGRWVHPVTGQIVEVDRPRLDRLCKNSNEFMKANRCFFPDGHSFKATDNLGFWKKFEVVGDRLIGIVEPTAAKAKEGLTDGSIRDVSAFIEFGKTDSEQRKYDEVVTHVCATPVPVVTRQGVFEPLSLDADPAGKGVEMLVPEDDSAQKAADALADQIAGLFPRRKEQDVDEKLTQDVTDAACELAARASGKVDKNGEFVGGFEGCCVHFQSQGKTKEQAQRLCAYIGRKAGKIK